MSDPPVETCPTCGQGPVEKLLFPVAVHFKGSGFYSTDYGKGKRKGAKDGEGGGRESTSTEKTDKPAGETSSADKGSGDKKSSADTG